VQRIFTVGDTWSGGSFELALELPQQSDEQLRRMARILWSHPSLKGSYLRNDVEPWQQEQVDPALYFESCLYGTARLPNGKVVACSTNPVREPEGTDWLYFGIPMGALSQAYPVGAFPFDDGLPLDWRDPMHDWLRSVGEWVYTSVPFRLGLIGWDAGSELLASVIEAHGIPATRYDGILWPEGQQLSWYPPTEGAPMTVG
jgi:hypothetical protein